MSGGWMLAGLRRRPGPVLGTLVAATVAATLTVAALATVWSHSSTPLGRLAGADVVVAGDPKLSVTVKQKYTAATESVPLPAYRGVPAGLADELARVPGVASAVGETGFPSGTHRPGVVDLVVVKADPGVGADALAAQIKGTLHGGAGYTIATGEARRDLADPAVAVDRATGYAFSSQVFLMLLLSALFAVAATTALSVNLRRGRFALLRAIGAKRGQVRLAVLTEQALIAVAGTVLGFLPGTLLGDLAVRALASHGILPAGSGSSLHPQSILIAGAVLLPVCVVSGLVSARRAARVSPASAVRELHAETGRPRPVRLLLGLAVAAGVVALDVASLDQSGAGAQLELVMPLLVGGMTAVALLGPGLVALAAAALRPLRRLGPSAGLALAGIRAQPRRTASAVVPVAMAVGMIGAVAFSDATISHAATTQSAQAVAAEHVLQGAGLDPAALERVRALPGATAAAGISTLNVAVPDPHLRSTGAAAVSGGRLGPLLDLDVTAGSLAELGPGQIAISAMEASKGVLGAHVGSTITVYLPDGTPYTATVSAIYARGLALGDILIPESAAAGHTGTGPAPAYSQILVDGAEAGPLAGLAAQLPGVNLTDRQIYNAQAQQGDSKNGFGDNLILAVIAALAAITMINTLVVSTLERRQQVHMLARIGAGHRQLAGMFAWQTLFVATCGIAAGAAVCAGALTAVNRAATGSPTPHIPPGSAALLISGVALLTAVPIMAAFRRLRRS